MELPELPLQERTRVLEAEIEELRRNQQSLAAMLSRSENNLRDALERLQLVMDNAPAAVTRCSGDLRYVWTSRSYASWLKRAPQEIEGRPIIDVIGQQAYEAILPHIEKVLSGEREEYETQVTFLGAGTRWIHAVYVPTKNQDHLVDGWIAFITDVTRWHEAEEALRNTEQQLRMAQNAAHLAGYSRNLATNDLTTFGEYAELYGFEADDAPRTFDEWVRLIHPDDRDSVQATLKNSRERGEDFEIEFRTCWPDGSIHWICGKGAIYRDETGQPIRTAGVNFDITERKIAEAALRESEERFRRVFEEGPLGVALVATDFRFLRVNTALCQLVGYGEEELLQKTFADITHPDDVRADVELAERLFRGEIPFYRMQKRYLKKTGEVIWINLTVSMIRDPDGKPLYALGMVEDITEVKRNQEEAFARQKLESIGTLANGIAHDFNNILGAVMAQAEVALAELGAGSPSEAELRAIRDVAMRGSEIVRQLMIYAGKESAIPGPIDLSESVEDMLALLRVSVSKHARLDIDLDKQLLPIEANPSQISQLVMNLVTNASEAIGDRDGVIRVTTKRAAIGTDCLGIDGLLEGKYVQLEVSDTGRGMSPGTKARVFDPFFSTKSTSRGLGLAVVHGIVQTLGGTIHLASDLGHGTTFLILLPCAETCADTRGPVSDFGQTGKLSKTSRVLLVEDEDALRRAASKMLNKRGFSVIEARDGSAALDVIRAGDNPIDVLFLDVTLPGTPGREVLEEAKRLRPEMSVIVTSAFSEEMAAASLQTSIKRFIRKPYLLNDLIGLIQSAPGQQ
jgi:PAS domain S-box-containing protein